ncbi:hypothetical protein PspLS_05242 [Pyricularia sp. CBS 133598]|nr:hypothetical protein PspLS_05242 [Pyricularia sp. CBS 133598]
MGEEGINRLASAKRDLDNTLRRAIRALLVTIDVSDKLLDRNPDGKSRTGKNQHTTAGLPNAFPVAARLLHVLMQLLRSLEKHPKTTLTAEVDIRETEKNYNTALDFTTSCQKQARCLEDLFEAVLPLDASEPIEKRISRYANVMREEGLDKVETVVQGLLRRAVKIAPTLVSEEVLQEVRAGLVEVGRVEPSLPNNPKGMVTLNNYGAGNMMYHGGTGHMNHASGGVQITGDHANISIPGGSMGK